MLQAIGLTKQFAARRPALADVSFTVADGELCALIGHNGAGKTTAMHCFLDLVRPDAGCARVDGVVVAEAPVAARRGISYLSEHVALYPAMTGRENVRFFARLAGRRTTCAEAASALEELGLPAAAIDRPTRTYSKGMRQRVGLAIAVATDARNFILDEPTSGLDPAAAAELMELLACVSRRGSAVLVSSHDIAHTARVVDAVVCLARGAVVATERAGRIDAASLERWFAESAREARAEAA
jgi:ABC-2 type transport system ATP-binding protein